MSSAGTAHWDFLKEEGIYNISSELQFVSLSTQLNFTGNESHHLSLKSVFFFFKRRHYFILHFFIHEEFLVIVRRVGINISHRKYLNTPANYQVLGMIPDSELTDVKS